MKARILSAIPQDAWTCSKLGWSPGQMNVVACSAAVFDQVRFRRQLWSPLESGVWVRLERRNFAVKTTNDYWIVWCGDNRFCGSITSRFRWLRNVVSKRNAINLKNTGWLKTWERIVDWGFQNSTRTQISRAMMRETLISDPNRHLSAPISKKSNQKPINPMETEKTAIY